MAGAYVHCLVSRESLKNLYADPTLSRYCDVTNPNESAPYFPYVCLGSVSPDYPYAAMKIGGVNRTKDKNKWSWGDKFHKQNTGNFVNIGLQELRSVADKTDFGFHKKLAWLIGYYSHIITDVVIHAVVYKIVGGCYEKRGPQHMHCEVVQDSMLFHEVYNSPQELIDVNFLRILQKCQNLVMEPTELTELPAYVLDADIKNLWDIILSKNYSDFYATETPQIDDWHRYYTFLMSVATKVLARDLESNEAYHKTTDISESDKATHYFNPILPDGTNGNYREKVFNRAVGHVTSRLKDFLNAIDSAGLPPAIQESLVNWNIDKGTIDGANPKFALWNGQTEYPFDCLGDPPSA